jgi:transcriptional regulator with XRE-family HTH domain
LFQNIGLVIRELRSTHNLSISELAEKLNVSVGYLSNLETGKSETVQLSFLNKLQEEFHLFPPNLEELQTFGEFEARLLHATHLLKSLSESHPEQADYFLEMIEKGTRLFLDEQKKY